MSTIGTMDCNEVVELVTAYLDNALDAETTTRFEAHLNECDGCENYLEQFRVTVRTVGRVDQDALDPTFRNRLLDTFRKFER